MQTQTLKFWNYTPVVKPEYRQKFCAQPFNNLQIDEDGDVMLCDCPAHMPYVIGNIYQDSLQNIWNSSAAAQVRQSVIDGNFTYCSWRCNYLKSLPDAVDLQTHTADFPSLISINLDKSCNLKCPSCREHVIMEKKHPRIQAQIQLFTELVTWAKQNPFKKLTLVPLASGDIFASHSGLAFLNSLRNYPRYNLKLRITTNGTLILRNQNLVQEIRPTLAGFLISIDAASAQTYATVRGGNWQDLMAGLKFINDIGITFKLRFVVQKNNYHEIAQFADLAHDLGAISVYYSHLEDWGHWTIKWWQDNSVLDQVDSSYGHTLDLLQSVSQKYPGKILLSAVLQEHLIKRNYQSTAHFQNPSAL